MERCRSGLTGTLGKRVYLIRVPGVRIPFSPREKSISLGEEILLAFLKRWRDENQEFEPRRRNDDELMRRSRVTEEEERRRAHESETSGE